MKYHTDPDAMAWMLLFAVAFILTIIVISGGLR